MDIALKLAELLADAFLYYRHPERHYEWSFPRNGDEVVVTVTIIKEPDEYKKAMTSTGWKIPVQEEQFSWS